MANPSERHTTASVAESPVHVTDKALAAVKAGMIEEGIEGHGLRIAVVGGGCAGLRYTLGFESERREGDTVWEVGGMRIHVDAMSLGYLQGAEVDYATGLDGAGFRFSNPNAVRGCGCGSSFAG